MLGAILEALGLWALALASGVVVTSALARLLGSEEDWKLASASQLTFALVSLALASLAGGRSAMGLTIDLDSSLRSLAVSLPLAATLSIPAARFSRGYRPPFEPEDPIRGAILALALAPIGEELLFRGLLEGRLLSTLGSSPGVLWVAIAIPAVLFSLVHVAPFSGAPRGYLGSVLAAALVLGVLAGYFRAVSGSLAPAVVAHACFNLAGMAVDRLFPSE